MEINGFLWEFMFFFIFQLYLYLVYIFFIRLDLVVFLEIKIELKKCGKSISRILLAIMPNDHSSSPIITNRIKRPTRIVNWEMLKKNFKRFLFGLSLGGACNASLVTK